MRPAFDFTPACSSAIAARIPLATSSHAESRFCQSVIGFAFFGSACRAPSGDACQSAGRMTTGITLA